MCGVRLNLTCHQVANDNAGRTTIDDDDVDEFGAVEQPDTTQSDLTGELLVRTEQQLLACLPARIEGTAHLSTAERAVVKQTTVFTSKRHTLGDHLVDDVDAHLSETMHIGLASTEVATFDGVVEQAVDAVAVALVVLGGVDATLCRDRVRTPG